MAPYTVSIVAVLSLVLYSSGAEELSDAKTTTDFLAMKKALARSDPMNAHSPFMMGFPCCTL